MVVCDRNVNVVAPFIEAPGNRNEATLLNPLFGIGAQRHWCTNRYFDKNIVGLLFLHHFHLKIWLSWHLAQQGKVQVVIK